ncbi:hypothetical protein LCGC14_1085010 [marine sediment metagenome]|uniref:Uncharacterized protein n=1 Tax=marine sediment metagenome TaxID=412755 RepID=A0A0F9QK08_9ZZZZ
MTTDTIKDIIYRKRSFPDRCLKCNKVLKKGDPVVRIIRVKKTYYPKRGMIGKRIQQFICLKCKGTVEF